jgi:hypothetical protein
MLFQGTAATEMFGRFSPDGRWVAYDSNETGPYEIYAREFALGADGHPEATTKHQISGGGGRFPIWGQDGKELLYPGPNRKTVMSVEISTQPAFRIALPTKPFALPAAITTPLAISDDGKRFLSQVPLQQNGPEPFTNWNPDLKE